MSIFDLEGIRPGEIAVTQYLRPNGRKTTTFALIGEEYVKKAKDMIFSSEVLTTGDIVIYGRLAMQPIEEEISDIADNFESDNSPDNVLRRIIDKLGDFDRRRQE